MKKNYTYRDCYKILGINPDCSWKELRTSYKKLIHTWHPDKYDDTSERKTLADEKIKSINIAYNHLQQYYRSNNALPSVTADDPSAEKKAPAKQQTADIRPKARVRKRPQVSARQPAQKAPARRTFYTVIIIILSLTAFYNIYTENMVPPPSEAPEQSPEEADHRAAQKNNFHDDQTASYPTGNTTSSGSTSEKPVRKKREAAKTLKYFTYGDSIGKVITAQGVPDKTEGDIWYYGESEVHFSYGKVTHWVRKAGSPLNIHLNIESPHRNKKH
ncbi:MAG TPA: J domain-containing protein [Gammaproteobacteria bacterium]|nr:J domain-containing protein [Gammaproteobacteria bacterium]